MCSDPAAEGRYGVLMGCGPYAKGLHFEDGRAGPWQANFAKSTRTFWRDEAIVTRAGSISIPEKWVPHGYVCVRVNSRGTGRSPGLCRSLVTARDQGSLRLHRVGRHTRPWSNGKVGLTGISYLAMNQWQVAAMQPPHLAAICPWEGVADHYRDCRRHGGILSTFMMRWFEARIPIAQYGVGERGHRNRITGKPVCGDETMTEEELVRNRADLVREMRDHRLLDGHFDRLNPDLSKIAVPLLSAGNWGGQGMHLRGNCEGFVRASSRQKWLRAARSGTLDALLYRLRTRAAEALLRPLSARDRQRLGQAAPGDIEHPQCRRHDGATSRRCLAYLSHALDEIYLDPATLTLSREPPASSRTLRLRGPCEAAPPSGSSLTRIRKSQDRPRPNCSPPPPRATRICF